MSFRHLVRASLRDRLAETCERVRVLRESGFAVRLPEHLHTVTQGSVRVSLSNRTELTLDAVMTGLAYYEWCEGHDVEGHYSSIIFNPDPSLSWEEREDRLRTLVRIVGITDNNLLLQAVLGPRNSPTQEIRDTLVERSVRDIQEQEDRRAVATLQEAVAVPRSAPRRISTPHGLVARNGNTSEAMSVIEGRLRGLLEDLARNGVVTRSTVHRVVQDPNDPHTVVAHVGVDLPARLEHIGLTLDSGVPGADRTVVQLVRTQTVTEEKKEDDAPPRGFTPGRSLDLGE